MIDPDQIPSVHRRALQWPVMVWLAAAWVLLWGEVSIANVLSGLAVALIVALVFPLPPIAFTGRIRPLGLIQLVARFCLDLVLASVDVARQALNFRHKPASSIVMVRLRSRSDLYMTLTAELLTLVPGSIVVEADRPNWTLYMHVLGARTDTDVARARDMALGQEERLIHALGADVELAAYNREKGERYQP